MQDTKESLIKKGYNDLNNFFKDVVQLCPTLNDNHEYLKKVDGNTVYHRFKDTITQELLNAYTTNDESAIFLAPTNSFVEFVGGKVIYKELSPKNLELLVSALQHFVNAQQLDSSSTIEKQKHTILLSFYKDLGILLTDLVKYCPGSDFIYNHLNIVQKNHSNVSFELFSTLSDSFTKDLLVHFLNRDIDAFFNTTTTNTAFVDFIGGLSVFEKLDIDTIELYWGTDTTPSLISSCIRHGLNLQTLLKNSDLLDSCMNMLPQTKGPVNMSNIFGSIQNTIKSGGMMDTITQLVNKEDGIKNAMDMLQSLLVSTTMDTAAAKEYASTKSPVVESDISPIIDSKDESSPYENIPSSIFKKDNAVRRKVSAQKEAEFPSNISALLKEMNNCDIGDIQNELKEAIDTNELNDIVHSVCDNLDPAAMLKGIQNGSIDFSKFI